jgi:hypothetical protein
MTKKRSAKRPASTLEAILNSSCSSRIVPTMAASRRPPVERTHHQLRIVESWANGLVAKISSFPLLMDVFRDVPRNAGRSSDNMRQLSILSCRICIFCICALLTTNFLRESAIPQTCSALDPIAIARFVVAGHRIGPHADRTGTADCDTDGTFQELTPHRQVDSTATEMPAIAATASMNCILPGFHCGQIFCGRRRGSGGCNQCSHRSSG